MNEHQKSQPRDPQHGYDVSYLEMLAKKRIGTPRESTPEIVECCVQCEQPKSWTNVAGNEVAAGWPYCVNPGCVAYREPTASAAYRERASLSPAEAPHQWLGDGFKQALRVVRGGIANEGTTLTADQCYDLDEGISRLVANAAPLDQMAVKAIAEHRAGKTKPITDMWICECGHSHLVRGALTTTCRACSCAAFRPRVDQPEADFQSTLDRMRQTVDDMDGIAARLAENSKAREAL